MPRVQKVRTEMKPYRPSNGTEGDIFMSRFCFECTRCNMEEDAAGPPCGILGRALGYSLGDPEYPAEWIQDDHGPRCTALTTAPEEETYRCEDTLDMFGGDHA